MLQTLEAIQKEFNVSATGGKKVSLADLIVLGGNSGVKKALKESWTRRKQSLHARSNERRGRNQQTSNKTGVLEPATDGFRNYVSGRQQMLPEEALVDKARLLTLTAPEMTVLVGGLRVLGANVGGSTHGLFTERERS